MPLLLCCLIGGVCLVLAFIRFNHYAEDPAKDLAHGKVFAALYFTIAFVLALVGVALPIEWLMEQDGVVIIESWLIAIPVALVALALVELAVTIIRHDQYGRPLAFCTLSVSVAAAHQTLVVYGVVDELTVSWVLFGIAVLSVVRTLLRWRILQREAALAAMSHT